MPNIRDPIKTSQDKENLSWIFPTTNIKTPVARRIQKGDFEISPTDMFKELCQYGAIIPGKANIEVPIHTILTQLAIRTVVPFKPFTVVKRNDS